MEHDFELGTKTFAMEDQRSMADWCGDYNPMHVDPVAARRLLTGRPVVHGIHLILEALARWRPHAPAERYTALKAEFSKPISVGDRVSFRASRRGGVDMLIAEADNLVHMSLSLRTSAPGEGAAMLPDGEQLAWSGVPFDQPAQQWLGRTVMLRNLAGPLPVAEAASGLVGEAGAALLGQLSTMVGMACPGLHSVFSSLDLVRRPAAGRARCQVRRFDPRFGLVKIAVDGAWHGEVRAFVRAAPKQQPSMSTVVGQVPASLAREHRTWVLGGSRGLGELAAKIAAAAGSEVTLTYATGLEDAQSVAEDINSGDRGRAHVAEYHAGVTPLETFCEANGLPNAVLYFATPRIAQRRGEMLHKDRLLSFMDTYCVEPARIAQFLETQAQGQAQIDIIRLFNPSSTYVDELPNGMVEYAMAKAAAEVLALDLNKRLRRVVVSTTRLPKLPTDQTNGLITEAGPSALEILAPVLRATLDAR